MIRTLRLLFIATSFVLTSSLVSASVVGPLTFASDNDYDNANPPANPAPNGLFRDFVNGNNINRGTDNFTEPSPGPYAVSALNFNSGVAGTGTNATTLYDTDPTNLTPSLFTGTIRLSTDFIQFGTNANQPGLIALFNEGAGKKGLALAVSEAGNTDRLALYNVDQTSDLPAYTLGLTAVTINVDDNVWYRLTMDVALPAAPITGASNVTVTGKVFAHSNPGGSVGAQLGGTLTYTATLNSLGLDTTGTGEVGLLFDVGANTSKAGFTNFSIDNTAILSVSVANGATIDFGSLATLDKEIASIIMSNTGATGSILSVTDATFAGADAGLFGFDSPFTSAFLSAGGASATTSYDVKFLGTTTPGNYTAMLSFVTSEGTLNYDLTAVVEAETVEAVPEPGALLLLSCGAVSLLGWRLRRRGLARRPRLFA